MAPVFWLGLGLAAAGPVLGLLAGARSRDTRALTGALIGAYGGLMAAFPLLAIGLSTS
jgi:hypothetical protein